MLRTLEAIAFSALLAVWGVTGYALLGPSRLTGRVASHFDLAGHPNGWGDASTFWILPAVATFIYLIMTLAAQVPAGFSDSLTISIETCDRIGNVTKKMVAWLKAEAVFLFVWIQWEAIRSARQGWRLISPMRGPLVLWLFLGTLGIAVFGTVAWSIVAIRRAGRESLSKTPRC